MRTLRHLGGLLLVAVLVLTGLVGLAPAAGALPAPADAEVTFFELLNAERTAAGLAPMQRDPGLDDLARDWSARMRTAGPPISHRPQLAAAIGEVEPRWLRGGENVGMGGDVTALHQAFMDSPAHRANVVGDFNRLGVGVVDADDRLYVTFNFLKGPALDLADPAPAAAPLTASAASSPGWVVGDDGTVRAIGEAPFLGDLGGRSLAKPIVGMAATPTGDGYWLVASDGGIFAFGDATFLGSTGATRLNRPIVGMAATPTGDGYWLVASDGGIFAFGDATFLGSTGATRLNRPIVGMAATPTGDGYWLVASDGGIFAFGDATFLGSTGDRRLAAAVQGITATPDGDGYWIVATDGSVYSFGSAPFAGSASGQGDGQPFTRIAATADGRGYRIATADGRVFSFGSAGSGATAPLDLRSPVVALANR